MALHPDWRLELNLHTSQHRPPVRFDVKRPKNPYEGQYLVQVDNTAVYAGGSGDLNVPAGKRFFSLGDIFEVFGWELEDGNLLGLIVVEKRKDVFESC